MIKKIMAFMIIAAGAGVGIAGCGSASTDTADSKTTAATTTKATTTATTTAPTTAPTTTPTTTAAPTTTTKESKEDFMAKCKPYEFKEIARNPEEHKGEFAKLDGKVIQVMEESGIYTLRVNITKDKYDYWDDTIMVWYSGSSDNNRILEDDIVTMYGMLDGMYTYTTVMGNENTVPLLLAEYIDIH